MEYLLLCGLMLIPIFSLSLSRSDLDFSFISKTILIEKDNLNTQKIIQDPSYFDNQ
jgi:hypothetical protein